MTIHFPFSRRTSVLCGATALTLSLVLAGCGGGGGGGGSTGPRTTTDTISPNTTPTTSGQNSSCSNSYTPNYEEDVTLLHWPLFPLRVYFKRDADSNYSPENQAIAVAGFDKWVQATNNGATYSVVNSASKANVTVSFYTFTGGPGDVLGLTQVTYFKSSKTITNAAIELGLTRSNRNNILTASHEFGHALGIFGHSSSNQDLMYFEGNDTKCGCITESDLNTMLRAYCGNFNKNPNARLAPDDGELVTVTIH